MLSIRLLICGGVRLIEIRLIRLQEPCSACVIIDSLIQEMIQKMQVVYPDVKVVMMTLDSLGQVREVEGLEVEKFPVLFVNGVQVTAGSLPTPQQMKIWFEG